METLVKMWRREEGKRGLFGVDVTRCQHRQDVLFMSLLLFLTVFELVLIFSGGMCRDPDRIHDVKGICGG